ncbi:MAG TPA: YfcE family phosphodiesterase [Firmicutes bacterium]|nr:YfcE family phosphodiesterase [Bacillota bacterium]
MKIVVVSDTHRQLDEIKSVLLKEKDADVFLHCGDSQLEHYQLYPFMSVQGNCDRYSSFPEVRIITTEYGNIVIHHGHLRYKYNLKYLKEHKAKICLFGHTHVKTDINLEGILFLNPGSLTCPRDGTKGSYLVINLTENNVDYEFKYL